MHYRRYGDSSLNIRTALTHIAFSPLLSLYFTVQRSVVIIQVINRNTSPRASVAGVLIITDTQKCFQRFSIYILENIPNL